MDRFNLLTGEILGIERQDAANTVDVHERDQSFNPKPSRWKPGTPGRSGRIATFQN